MKPVTLLALLCMVLFACNTNVKKTVSVDTLMPPPPPPPVEEHAKKDNIEPVFKDRVTMAIDSTLSHKKGGFKCDSVLILSYKFHSTNSYMPLTDDGRWIPDAVKRKKLTSRQFHFINSVFGSPKTFRKEMMACFIPGIGFAFLRMGK